MCDVVIKSLGIPSASSIDFSLCVTAESVLVS